MNKEAPTTIWIEKDKGTGLFYKYFVNRLDQEITNLESVEYIRKDIYDEVQARIKELEEALTKESN